LRRRFFVEAFQGDRAELAGEAAYHLGRVLRAAPGQIYELSDGETVRLGKIEFAGKDRVEFSLLEQVEVPRSNLQKTLLLAVVKFDAFEWALEKATELGVERIVPLAAGRSEKGLLAGAAKRSERWKRIVFEASQQSRRVRLPVIAELVNPAEAFSGDPSELKVLLSERPEAAPLCKVLAGRAARQATLAIGPEGGWLEAEFSAAKRANFVETSLGRSILRTETAVVAALANLNFALEAS
jgi:16S rRNA (uracil1498-N3)-methyltransferase